MKEYIFITSGSRRINNLKNVQSIPLHGEKYNASLKIQRKSFFRNFKKKKASEKNSNYFVIIEMIQGHGVISLTIENSSVKKKSQSTQSLKHLWVWGLSVARHIPTESRLVNHNSMQPVMYPKKEKNSLRNSFDRVLNIVVLYGSWEWKSLDRPCTPKIGVYWIFCYKRWLFYLIDQEIQVSILIIHYFLMINRLYYFYCGVYL